MEQAHPPGMGSRGWHDVGYTIVMLIGATVLFLGWAYLVSKIVDAFGGNSEDDSTGVIVCVSFALFVVPFLVAFLKHR